MTFVYKDISSLHLAMFERDDNTSVVFLMTKSIVVPAVHSMHFSKVKLFKFQNRIVLFTIKRNNYGYLNVYDENLDSLLTINMYSSTDLEWVTADEAYIFCLNSKAEILIYDWVTGSLVGQLSVLSRDFLNAIPLDATQIESYKDLFIFKCKNSRIKVLKRESGQLISDIKSDANFLVDSANNRLLMFDVSTKMLMMYSFDIDLLSQIRLINIPESDFLKMDLNTNSDILFVLMDMKRISMFIHFSKLKA